MKSLCEEDRNCGSRAEYEVDCVSQDSAGVKIPTDLATKISKSIMGGQTAGVCLATKEGAFDINATVFEIGEFAVTWLYLIIFVVILLFIPMLKPKS